MLNLDTHILIQALNGDLSSSEKKILGREKWGISAIVLWEVAKLHSLGRIEMDLNDNRVAKVFSNITIWPLELKVCQKLKELDFSSDPADEIIAATSLVHNVPLVTRDKKILKSKLIRFANA